MTENKIILFENGKRDFDIITMSNQFLAANEAVAFLQSIFLKIGNSEVSFSTDADQAAKHILLKKEAEELLCKENVFADGYRIQVSEKDILISASTDRGLLYGAYGFCEKFLGVRFLHAEETLIPKRTAIEIPVGVITENPFFDMHTYLDCAMFEKGCLAFASHVRSCSNWMNLGEKYGGESPMFGRMRTDGSVSHNILTFVPLEKYKDTHPEFYIKDRNAYGDLIKPDIVNGITQDGELDESMEVSVVKSIIEEMKKDILANPDKKYFAIEQEDGVAVVDEERYPDLVKKYKQSGVLIRTMNVVARELQKWADSELNGREINVVTFAYQGTSVAPVYKENGKYYPIDKTVLPEKNLVIRMAVFANAYYGYFSDRAENAKAYEKILSWNSICNRFMFWAYDIDFHDYFNYFPSFGVIADNVRGFYKLGVKSLLVQGAHNFKQSWQCNMRAYIYRRLCVDINLSEEALFEEYIHGFYGEIGGEYVQAFIKRMNAHYGEVLKNDPTIMVVSKTPIGKAKYLSKQLLQECIQQLEDGIEKIGRSEVEDATKEKYTSRLQEVLLTPLWMYLNNYVELNDGNVEGRKELALQFFALCKKLGVNQYNEVALVFDPVPKYEIPPLYEKFDLGGEISGL